MPKEVKTKKDQQVFEKKLKLALAKRRLGVSEDMFEFVGLPKTAAPTPKPKRVARRATA